MGSFGSKSQSWEVSDDKKAAEEIPGVPTEHVAEGQVKVKATDAAHDEGDAAATRNSDDQRKSDVSAHDEHVHGDAPEHHHHDAPEHHHPDAPDHHHHDDEVAEHHHHHGDAAEHHHENEHNGGAARPYEEEPAVTSGEGMDHVTAGMQQVAVRDDQDQADEKPLVNVDIVWEHGGNEVFLVASFTEWQQVLLHSRDGVHKATFAVPPGKHTYKFIVDGEERVDETHEHEDGHNILHV